MNKQNEQQPIIHYVCKECQDKGLITPPCVHFKGDNEKECDCKQYKNDGVCEHGKGIAVNTTYNEKQCQCFEFFKHGNCEHLDAVQDNKGTWEVRYERKWGQEKGSIMEYEKVKSFIANEKAISFAEGVEKGALKGERNRLIAQIKQAAQEEVVREILKLSYNEMVGDGDGGAKNGELIVSVEDIKLYASVRFGINLSASNE